MDYATLSAATLTDMFNAAFGKAVKVGTYPKSKMVADLTAHAAQASGLYTENPDEVQHGDDEPASADLSGAPIHKTPTPEDEAAYQEQQAADPLTFEEQPGGVGYPAPAAPTEEEALIAARLEKGECPFCGGDPANQTAAGEEGTFLGDSCKLCHDCDKTYNAITGVEVPTRDVKKRRILNPQGKIDAKEAALLEVEFDLTYDRTTRLWTVASNREGEVGLWNMASKEFAGYSPKEIVASAEARLRTQA